MSQTQHDWKYVLTLDSERRRVAGSEDDLAAAIRRGADLRIYTEFRNNEHLDTKSDNSELVREVSEFRVTYLLDDRWVAGIMSLRQPILPPVGFGPRPSMSFFLYNQDGQQAIARPHLDGASPDQDDSAPNVAAEMPKYHQIDNWDAGTNAPSHNFVYDFDTYRFCVRDDWREVFAHTADGTVIAGSLDALTTRFVEGCEIKLAIRGLCDDLPGGAANDRVVDVERPNPIDHEVFIQTGPSYFHTDQRLLVTGTHPLVRVAPGIPLQYASGNWDFGWLMARSDGFVARSLVDPRTLRFHNSDTHHAMRWLVR
jgi:hypothetical protein